MMQSVYLDDVTTQLVGTRDTRPFPPRPQLKEGKGSAAPDYTVWGSSPARGLVKGLA